MVRIGIIGIGFMGMIHYYGAKKVNGCQVTAICTRSPKKLDGDWTSIQGNFGPRGGIEDLSNVATYNRIEDLLADPNVDLVNICLPTEYHKEVTIAALKAGKHVLCEKPCGIDTAELKAQLAACNEAGVQFMDGVMFMHSTRLDALSETMTGGSIREVRRINSQFSFNAGEDFLTGNIRMHSDLEPLGCLGDLGWYNIRFSLWAMDYAMPQAVSGRMLRGAARSDSPDKVPMEFSGELFYENGVTASYYCSFVTGNQQWAHVCGTEGSLRLDDFVVTYYVAEVKYTVSNTESNQHVCDFTMEEHDRTVAV